MIYRHRTTLQVLLGPLIWAIVAHQIWMHFPPGARIGFVIGKLIYSLFYTSLRQWHLHDFLVPGHIDRSRTASEEEAKWICERECGRRFEIKRHVYAVPLLSFCNYFSERVYSAYWEAPCRLTSTRSSSQLMLYYSSLFNLNIETSSKGDMKQIPCHAKWHLMHFCVREVPSKIIQYCLLSLRHTRYFILRQISIFPRFSPCSSPGVFCTHILLLRIAILHDRKLLHENKNITPDVRTVAQW